MVCIWGKDLWTQWLRSKSCLHDLDVWINTFSRPKPLRIQRDWKSKLKLIIPSYGQWFSVCSQQTRQFRIIGFLCILQLVPLILHLKCPISHNLELIRKLMELIRKQLQIYPYIFQKSMIKSYACNNSCSLSAEIFYYHSIDCFRQNKKLFQKLVHLSL